MNRNISFGQIIRVNKFFVTVGLLSVVLRLMVVINGGKSLFDSGQDAPTYYDAALDFNQFGWFSNQVSSLPVWPAGYPFFLSVLLTLGGTSGWMLVSLFQHILFLSAVTYFIYELRRYLSTEQRYLLAAILLLMPSFIYSPSENMYESLLASLLLVGIAACLDIFQAETIRGLPTVIAITSFGFAGFLQAKTAPIGILIMLIISIKKKNRLFLYAPLTLWGVALTIHRSFVAYGIFSPSINYSVALTASGPKGMKIPCKISSPLDLSPAQLGASMDQQYVLCSIKYFALHPNELVTHMGNQARALFGPIDGGGVNGATTWFHGLGFQRIAGFLGFSDSKMLFKVENFSALFLNLLIIAGFVLATRTLNHTVTLIMTLPIVVISIVHLISDGDARYRLPFLPFQLVFLVVFLAYCRNRFLGVEKERVSSP